jgi:hypothetical protein
VANTRNGNSFYVDTEYTGASDELAIKNIRVLGVVVTASASPGTLVLSDAQTSEPTKLDLRVATANSTAFFDFSECPITFPNGIRPTTLTDALATIIIEETRG